MNYNFGLHTSSAVCFKYTRCESPIGYERNRKETRTRWNAPTHAWSLPSNVFRRLVGIEKAKAAHLDCFAT